MPESDPSIMPEVKIITCPPPMEGIARAIRRIRTLGAVTELCLSEHNRGAQDGGDVAQVQL